jgi:Tn3 transposase DDE domain
VGRLARGHCRALSLPTEADALIEQLAEDLDDAYHRTREGLTADHAIHALAARGELPVDRLDVLPESASLTTLRASVDALMPPADLPDLVLEIAAKTEFLHEFTNDHESNAQLRDLEISLCAVLVAQACNVGYRPLVDDSNPALRESRLRYVAQRYLRADTLAAANARIVDYHAKLPLSERWGWRGGRLDRRAPFRRSPPNDSRGLQPPLLRPPPWRDRARHDRRPLRRAAHDRDPRHPT